MKALDTDKMRRRWVTLTEAAVYAGVSPKTLRRRIVAGELEARRIGASQHIRVELAAVDRMMRPIHTAGNGA